MKIYAISDLHLSLESDKPMNIFGDNWQDHHLKIQDNWLASITEDDLVLLCGDISWALKLHSAQPDLDWIGKLPGRKIFIKGNHDYWWASLNKITAATNDSMFFIQNNAICIDGISIAGTRLWDYPYVKWPSQKNNSEENTQPVMKEKKHGGQIIDNEKVCASELNRLKLSLSALEKNSKLKICLTHYPPISRQPEENELTALMTEHEIDFCIYGHLHALDREEDTPAADCKIGNTRYLLSSCDWLDFSPLLIAEV